MKEINKEGYDLLISITDNIKKEAEISPVKNSEGYLLQAGKQQAYSHCWYEMKSIIDTMDKPIKGYINWKIFNLLLGLFLGMLLMYILLL